MQKKKRNPADVTSEVKLIIITVIACNFTTEAGAVIDAFHKCIYPTSLTRQGL